MSTFRHLDSGEIVRVDGNQRTLVRCRQCGATVDTTALARRGLCRHCNLPAVLPIVRKLLNSGPKPDATFTATLRRLGVEVQQELKLRDMLDVDLMRIDGRPYWALPQHRNLAHRDAFHRELVELLRRERSSGSTAS